VFVWKIFHRPRNDGILAFHDDNFCKFHVSYACKGDACALKTRGRFLTERGKKKVNYPTLHPLSYRNKIGDKFGDATTVTVWEKEK